MTAIAALKAEFGLLTADELTARPKPPEDHRRVRAKWPVEMRLAFNRLQPHALCIVATEAPVTVALFDRGGALTRRIGHNRGCWPMRTAMSGAWPDTVTATYNRSPFVWTGAVVRLWLADRPRVVTLRAQVDGMIEAMAEAANGAGRMLSGFWDVGPDVDLLILESEIAALAQRAYIGPVWDDHALEMRVRKMAGEG